MAIRILTVLTLQQPLKIIISATDVAGLVKGIIQVFIGNDHLDFDNPVAFENLGVWGSAVWAFGGEFAAFHDAGEAEVMPTAQLSDCFYGCVFEVSETDRAFDGSFVFLLEFDFIGDSSQPLKRFFDTLRIGKLFDKYE